MKVIFLFFTLIVTNLALAQHTTNSIEGKLFDSSNNNESITFANVVVKGLGKSSLTDYRGNYVLKNLTPGKYTLLFSFLGYETKEVTVEVIEGKKKLNVYLETTKALNFDDIKLAVNNN
ncbi:carboxypeptidase-like regulatory domain-containing protein [Aquimarina agarivorans]|uniref:carboxypeptidase-like regulatory domain-containing protein n=1 Tax=Aquimarina agarivorans TaxID=980584 RepID=UPI000248F014|nr:carboxypeptidase-like regulatory domain-containing protein [Aquimarina agarivorans]